MKKKLLSLLVLLMAAVSGAWADELQTEYTSDAQLNAVTVSASMEITIADGATVTINGGLFIEDNATLTVNGPGKLVVKGTKGSVGNDASGYTGAPGGAGFDGGAAITGNIVVKGATVEATGGDGGDGGRGGIGSYNPSGPGGKGGQGGKGAAAFTGAVTIYSGTIIAKGGSGGDGGAGGYGDQNLMNPGNPQPDGDQGEGGDGGNAFAGTLTFYGGTVKVLGSMPGYGKTNGNASNAFVNPVTMNATTYELKGGYYSASDEIEFADILNYRYVDITAADYVEATFDYAFTVVPTDHGSGTIKFFIDNEEVQGAMQADEGKTVTMTVTPDEGWMVDATKVSAVSYTTWEAAGARRRSAPENITILDDITLTFVSTNTETGARTYSFTMPAASVLVSVGYIKISTLAFKPAPVRNMTVTVNGTAKTPTQVGRIYTVTENSEVKLNTATGYKFRKVEVKKGVDYSVDLSKLTSNYEAMDGDILSGTTDKTISIANGAHVTLQGVNITSAAAIVCNGNATITLAAGSENIVTSTTEYNSGIRAGGNNTTLTINGTGKLTVKGAKRGAGIGSNRRGVCGNIVIEDGEIIATTGDYGAGIGSGYHATCGNITIKGGTITATGGNCAAGIGSSFDTAICGDILISGGTITAKGGPKAAGIGTGSAQQGFASTCGNITITNGVTKVTATKGNNVALHSIGKGENVEDKAYCGTVTIGGVEGYISESPYTYDPHQQ